ncbi:MAG: hypothetical protein Q8P12_01960 [bacterium]|nr:hypothetical protein [bacterium]
MKRNILIIIAAFVLVLAGAVLWPGLFGGDRGQIACTQEAKLCPDGSYVGRTGPNCEFAACPGEGGEWRTFRNDEEGIEFEYPESLKAAYIYPVDWPPQVVVMDEPYSCPQAGFETPGSTEEQIIGGRAYCVTETREGAAGSVYASFAYVTNKDERAVAFVFTLREVQCGNYGDPERTECEAERESFEVGGILDRMAQSLKLQQ